MPQSVGGSSAPSFDVDMEDEDVGMDNMPRLGASPGPQIPPSSPTEFLSFYSETANNRGGSKTKPSHIAIGASPVSSPSKLMYAHPHHSASRRTVEEEGELDRTLTNLSSPPTKSTLAQDIDVVNSPNTSHATLSTSVDTHKKLHVFVEDDEESMIAKRKYLPYNTQNTYFSVMEFVTKEF